MRYNTTHIFYFSGTGNSKNVALWMSQVAASCQTNCRITDISRMDRTSIEPPDPDALAIFISPIHGFNYPPVMFHFILRFPKGKNKVVLMNTRAGMLIGKFVTPGITGIAFYISWLILKLKGYTVKALYPVDLPSNWISLHPGLNQRTVQFIHEKMKEKVLRFGEKIFSGKSDFKALFEIYDLFLLPVAFMYYFVGRFIFAKTFFASADCNSCDLCIKGCPVKAIIKIDQRPYWTFNCESCMKCMGNCPKKAIETGHGYILSYFLLSSLVVVPLFYNFFESNFFALNNGVVRMIVESVIFLSVLALWYRIIHFFMRYKKIERLMVYTSLTKFNFWGSRYKAPGENDQKHNP